VQQVEVLDCIDTRTWQPGRTRSVTRHPSSAVSSGMRHHHSGKWRGAGMLDLAPFTAVQFSVCTTTGPLAGVSNREI
jgi:hypothetical protein